MKKLKMEVILTYDDKIMHGNDREAREWFFKYILRKDKLTLYSRELVDEIGNIKITKIINQPKGNKLTNKSNNKE